MSTPSPQQPPAPGWYPDPWNEASTRWWDGTTWTASTGGAHPLAPNASPGRPVRPALPAGAPIYGPFIWMVALLPLVSLALLPLMHPDLSQYTDLLRRAEIDPGSVSAASIDPFSMFGPGYFVALAVSPLLYAAMIVLSYLDWRRLQRIGVVRPFHWAWAFLNPVYPIGRSVIVRRVAAPRGFAPAWVAIAVSATSIVFAIIWSIVLFAQAFSQLTDAFPTT